MKAAHVTFAPRTRAATWREQFDAVLIGSSKLMHVAIWRLGSHGNRDDVVAVLEGRDELEQLARKILRRCSTARRIEALRRGRHLRVVPGSGR